MIFVTWRDGSSSSFRRLTAYRSIPTSRSKGSKARFLICDNDEKFPFAFEHVLAGQSVRLQVFREGGA